MMSLISDPLWYKDAIIYELHVRTFYDSNGDGYGDFVGLINKLDYLQDLGVTALWLLPFYPSPLRDDGYDISDYLNVHPLYGSLRDFKRFIRDAHQRDMRVITELVINHTSDEHPWFQASRYAKPNSPQRNFYIWSDTDEKFPETRIIFSDTERSNWAYDAVAEAYYWHRFFSHQPDLNHNNPDVVKAIIKVLRFWLDLGVDGLRLDAIPYLCVREGTNNENLPETHEVIKQIRHTVEEHYQNRMLLAEANQWPEDVRAYFGEGDECHMAFHFPLMPRIFMAIRKEDRHPITEIISRTPEIPYSCQWGLFLRNHDELTLEMVTDDERDYMYREYAQDPLMKINMGIRRRLAPLVDNNYQTIQMLNSLLFSFPGTPIIYYGDEIGMGDNIYLGDRDSVRTPMQWSIDRNAGFSMADPAKLCNPIIMDPVYGYQAVNAEAQGKNPSSLLNFMKQMISLRKQYKAFGRGTLEFLHPINRKILVYIRRYKQEKILCVVNLSRSVQPVELDLSTYKDLTPMEMFGRTEFPTIGDLPYFLTLGPHGFYWFKLEPLSQPIHIRESISKVETVIKTVDLDESWESLWYPEKHFILEKDILPAYLPKQHWYLSHDKTVQEIRLLDWCKVGANFYFMLCRVTYEEDKESPEQYFVPIKFSAGISAQSLVQEIPECVLAFIKTPKEQGILYDALFDETVCINLLTAIEDNRYFSTEFKGKILLDSALTYSELRKYENEPLTLKQITPRDKNTSIFYDDWMILKICRKVEEGPNPDIELRDFLSRKTSFSRIPPVRGTIRYKGQNTTKSMDLGLLQNFVPNEGDVWTFCEILLKNYFNRIQSIMDTVPELPYDSKMKVFEYFNTPLPDMILKYLGSYTDFFRQLGKRTAELHLALASETRDKAFMPEPFNFKRLNLLKETSRQTIEKVLIQLEEKLEGLGNTLQEKSKKIIESKQDFLDFIHDITEIPPSGQMIRCHGNLHIGNILKLKDDFLFIDFEGDLHLPLHQRREKHLPLVDIATVFCSIADVCNSVLSNYLEESQNNQLLYVPWAREWQHSVYLLIIKGYMDKHSGASLLPQNPSEMQTILLAMMLNQYFKDLSDSLAFMDKRLSNNLNGILQIHSLLTT